MAQLFIKENLNLNKHDLWSKLQLKHKESILYN